MLEQVDPTPPSFIKIQRKSVVSATWRPGKLLFISTLFSISHATLQKVSKFGPENP